MNLAISFKNLVTWELIKNIFPYVHKNNKNKDKKHQQQWQQTLLERERKFVKMKDKKNPEKPSREINQGWLAAYRRGKKNRFRG